MTKVRLPPRWNGFKKPVQATKSRKKSFVTPNDRFFSEREIADDFDKYNFSKIKENYFLWEDIEEKDSNFIV